MEIFDIVTEDGQPTGETVAREIAHRDGILHRTAHVWIIRETDGKLQILLQKRSMDKDSFPGLYDTSSAGHIPAGDEPVPSALRELEEELGISANEVQLEFAGRFRIQYEKEFHGSLFRDNEVSWVYVYREPVEISQLKLQASEVDEVRWFDLDEVCEEIKYSRERFCVPSGSLTVLKEWNHKKQRLWLIRQLLDEEAQYQNYQIPEDEQGQKDLLRALMNVRLPKPIDEAFLKVQDVYLTEENSREDVVSQADLMPCQSDSRIFLWQGDITTLNVDAIVNAANSGMTGCYQPLHACIDNVIGSKAGIRLRLKCNEIMEKQGHEEPTGQAKITPGYNLPCKYILHTVGPIVRGSLTKEHEELLASCYRSCLNLAEENGLKSIAFCCISTGVFMFPNERAAEIAVDTVKNWLAETGSKMKVIFNVFKDIDRLFYEQLL